jgi:hypothetical protein
MVKIACPSCHASLRCPERLLNSEVRCVKCGGRFRPADPVVRSRPDGRRFPWRSAGKWAAVAALAAGIVGFFAAVGSAAAADSGGTRLEGAGAAALFFLGLFVAVAVYFAPTIIAERRKHPNAAPIMVINILFGLTLIGWAVALVWALTAFRRSPDLETSSLRW